jgi:hypothetical protein
MKWQAFISTGYSANASPAAALLAGLHKIVGRNG